MRTKELSLVVCTSIILICCGKNDPDPGGGIVLSTTTPKPSGVNSAISGGTITGDGGFAITSLGVCWHTSSDPTVANVKTIDFATGAGGVFSSKMTGLTAGTLYFVRAYASNSKGTNYGNQVSFLMPTCKPSGSSGYEYGPKIELNANNVLQQHDQIENLLVGTWELYQILPSDISDGNYFCDQRPGLVFGKDSSVKSTDESGISTDLGTYGININVGTAPFSFGFTLAFSSEAGQSGILMYEDGLHFDLTGYTKRESHSSNTQTKRYFRVM